MGLASFGFSVSGVNTANSVLVNVKAAAAMPCRVLEVGLFNTVLPSTAYDLSLIRMLAVGTGAITSAAGAHHETGATAVTLVETAWATTRPTTTGQFFRRGTIPLTLGQGIIWPIGSYGNGILIPAAGGLCLQCITASGATLGTLEGYIMWDE